MMLRDFLYLETRSIINYLSTIEEGLVDHVTEKDSQMAPQWKFNIETGELQTFLANTMGIPLPKTSIERKGKGEDVTIDISKKPTIESQFDKLFSYLSPIAESFENIENREDWEGIQKGQFLVFSGKLKVPSGYKEVQKLKRASELLEFMDRMNVGSVDEVEDFDDIKEYVDEAEQSIKTNVYLTPDNFFDSSKYYFVGKIIHKYLCDIELMEADMESCKIFARVEKVLEKGESHSVFDYTFKGVDQVMNREQRRKQKGTKEIIETAKNPAIILKVIAIYTD